jgi:hypothetical protein
LLSGLSEAERQWLTERIVLLCSYRDFSPYFDTTQDIERAISRVKAYYNFIINRLNTWFNSDTEIFSKDERKHRVIVSCILAAINMRNRELLLGDVFLQCYLDGSLRKARAGDPRFIEQDILENVTRDDINIIHTTLRLFNCTNEREFFLQFWLLWDDLSDSYEGSDIRKVLGWPTSALASWRQSDESIEEDNSGDRDARGEFPSDDFGVETLTKVGGLKIRWVLRHAKHLALDKKKSVLSISWFPIQPAAVGYVELGVGALDFDNWWYRLVT